jgi:hypothetical protein
MVGRLRLEAGQTVVLVAALLPLLLGLGAIAVDVGYWYVVRKAAQDAADAAALAAARELGTGSLAKARAEATAGTYVVANMPDASWTVEFPYVPNPVDAGNQVGGDPDYTKVEVTVSHETGSFFGRLFGLIEPTVSRRAVAERIPGGRNLAIFSHGYRGCDDGLEIDAIGTWIDGLVHSNGQYDVHSGSGDDALWAADGTIWRENCVSNLDPEPGGAEYGPGPDFLPRDVWQMANWPAWYTPADFGWPSCSGSDFSGERIEILATEVRITDPDRSIAHAGVIPTGTYCATESFTIVASDIRGSISVLAPSIRVEGSQLDLFAHSQDVLFFAVPNADASPANDGSLGQGGNQTCIPSAGNELFLDGDRHKWSGVVFNPCGRVVLNTSDSRIEGSVIAESVLLTGARVRLTGTGTLAAPVGLAE